MACNVRAVSLSDSPFATLDPPALKLMTSAESRLAASSNEILVRVEFSRKKFTTVRPRRAGTFLITRVPTSRNDSAVSRIRVTSVELRSCIDSRCSFMSPRFLDEDRVLTVQLGDEHPDVVRATRRHVLPDEVRSDRQLAVAAIDEHGQLDLPGTPQVHQGVHRGPDRATREQDVIHQHDDLPGDVERDPC